MKTALFCFLLAGPLATLPADKAQLKPADLPVLTGPQWKGTLTYKDYGNGQQVSLAANLTVTQAAGNERMWLFRNEYPKEPHANSTDTVTMSADGTLLRGQQVLERTQPEKGALRLVTEKKHVEDGQPQLHRYTYLISANRLTIRNEEQQNGSTWLERNRYEYER